MPRNLDEERSQREDYGWQANFSWVAYVIVLLIIALFLATIFSSWTFPATENLCPQGWYETGGNCYPRGY